MEIISRQVDEWGNTVITYMDVSGLLYEEIFYVDGGSSFRMAQ